MEYGILMKRREVYLKRNTLIPIIAIDDVTGILLIQVAIILRISHQLAIKLKDLAKVYNMIVLAVPSSNTYIKATGHMSSLEK
jgi:hypothetical protein